MKNKKGFTLVELLAVIVLLGVLIGIAVPSVLGISKNIKEKMYESKLKTIEVAVEQWAEDNKRDCDTLKDKTIDDLVTAKYIKSDDNKSNDVNDPRNNSSMNSIKISNLKDKDGNKYIDVDKICENYVIAARDNYTASPEAIKETKDYLQNLWSSSPSARSYANSYCNNYGGCLLQTLVEKNYFNSSDFDNLADSTTIDDYSVTKDGITRNRYEYTVNLYKDNSKSPYNTVIFKINTFDASDSVPISVPTGYHFIRTDCLNMKYNLYDDFVIYVGEKEYTQNITCSIYFEPGIATSGGY